VAEELAQLSGLTPKELRDARRQKFLDMGRSGLV
jgi:acetyl-CoA carboxylase alpha subunit